MARGLVYLGLGAALMYLFDPQAGRRRRAGIRNQIDSTVRKVQHGRDVLVRDTRNRTHGMVLETRHWIEARKQGNASEGSLAAAACAVTEPWTRKNWSPAQRALAGAVGASLAAIGYLRGGLKGFALCMLGGALVARASTNQNLAEIGHKGIYIEKTEHVDAPVGQVFAYWRNLENLPQWMSHVREVRYLGGDRYHWVVDGPAGAPVEWDSELLNVVENREMTWHAVEGSTVHHTGRVRFEEDGDGTRIHVQLRYHPPGGVIGHAVARAFGVDPKSEMDDDLMRMKSAIETGRPPHDAAARRLAEETPSSQSRH